MPLQLSAPFGSQLYIPRCRSCRRGLFKLFLRMRSYIPFGYSTTLSFCLLGQLIYTADPARTLQKLHYPVGTPRAHSFHILVPGCIMFRIWALKLLADAYYCFYIYIWILEALDREIAETHVSRGDHGQRVPEVV